MATENSIIKRCTKCGETKPDYEFSKEAKSRNGLTCYCKACAKAATAAWRTANPDRANQSSVKWKTDNPEKVKAYMAAWYVDNSDRKKAAVAARHAANPEAARIKNNNRRARKRANGGKLSPSLAAKLFKLQRGKCACGCKQPLGDDYHLDHHMPLALGGANEDWNIQLLRATCNLQKHAKHPVDFMQQRGFLL